MIGVVLIHINEYQAQFQKKRLKEVLAECKKEKIPIYNLPPLENLAKEIINYKGEISHIAYRETRSGIILNTQFLDTKCQLIEHDISNVAIAGQSEFLCVRNICALLNGNPAGDWRSANVLGWTNIKYDQVIKTRISNHILYDLIM